MNDIIRILYSRIRDLNAELIMSGSFLFACHLHHTRIEFDVRQNPLYD